MKECPKCKTMLVVLRKTVPHCKIINRYEPSRSDITSYKLYRNLCCNLVGCDYSVTGWVEKENAEKFIN